jgi:PPOX class probable F420-dependent enzyme
VILDPVERAFLAAARTAILATIDPTCRPRLVPICFVLEGATVLSPLDEKPKTTDDPRSLARVRDILERPEVELLVHRWDEDWSRLAWLRVDGRGRLVEPGAVADGTLAALRAKYPQYATHRLEERPLLAIEIERTRAWGPGLSDPAGGAPGTG